MTDKSVAIVLYYPGSLKFHPSIMNTAALLAADGYRVDIFKPFNPDEGDLPSSAIRVVHGCVYSGNPLTRILSLGKLISSMLKAGRAYSALIGIDAYGLLVASAANRRFRSPVIYFSLELLSLGMNACDVRTKGLLSRYGYYTHHALLKWIEKRLHRQAALTLIQDDTRWAVLRRLNGLRADAPAIFIPNSPFADKAPKPPSDYLRRKFGIPADKLIVLYAGSLGVWTGMDRIAEAAKTWSDRFVLVLHGRGLPQFMRDLSETAANSGGKIILSLDQLVESEYEEMLRSADIGLSWYADRDDPNVYYIGAGSGKLFYYLKHGLPVVTNRFPGLPEIVETNSVGVCLEQEGEIGDGLAGIEKEYQRFSENARSCFSQYEFANRFSDVLSFLRSKTN